MDSLRHHKWIKYRLEKDLRRPILIVSDSLLIITDTIIDTQIHLTFIPIKYKETSFEVLKFNQDFQVLKTSNWDPVIEEGARRSFWQNLDKYQHDFPAKYSCILMVSRVIFNSEKNYGLFKFDSSCSWCGNASSHYFVIKKEKDTWKIKGDL